MIRNFLEEKYGSPITNQLMTPNKEVIWDKSGNNAESQLHVRNHLLQLGELIPPNFMDNSIEWGMDFSSWIGEFNNDKEYFFIGAEPHLDKDFQLVYDFGNITGKSLTETAMSHYGRKNDIWFYLTQIFDDELSVKSITTFLSKCYITDLCHLVPKGCGQVPGIVKKLSIRNKDWSKFRTDMAKRFLVEEIKVVHPKFIILHGNVARNFFNKEIGVNYTTTHPIEDSKWNILSGEFEGYKIISMPHLKGDMKNKLWKCNVKPRRFQSAKRILNDLINKS